MDTHRNAPLTPKGREAMVRCVTEKGLSKAAAARQFNTTPKTVAKWLGRFRADGVDGLRDRSSRPLSLPSQTAPATCTAVEALRRQRYTGNQIAVEVGVSPATVSRICGGSASIDSRPWNRLNRCAATSGNIPARSSISISKSSAVSNRSATASPVIARARATAWSRLGISASGDRRPLARRLLRNPARRKAQFPPALFIQRVALLSGAWSQGSARHDRQWRQLPISPLRQGATLAQNQAPAYQALYR
jgi:transposase-like protein